MFNSFSRYNDDYQEMTDRKKGYLSSKGGIEQRVISILVNRNSSAVNLKF